MKKSLLATWAALASVAAALAGFSYVLRTTSSHAIYAACGLGLALSAAASLGPLALLFYFAIEAAFVDGLDAVRRRFRSQALAIAGLLLVSDIWPTFDFLVFPAERATDTLILKWIQIGGLLAFSAAVYWRFRLVRIQAHPERSAEIRKKFAKWEGAVGRIVYLTLLVFSMYSDAKQDVAQGHILTVVWASSPFLLIVVAMVALRLRMKAMGREAAKAVSH